MMKLDGNGKDTRREEGIFLVNIDSLPDDEKCLISLSQIKSSH